MIVSATHKAASDDIHKRAPTETPTGAGDDSFNNGNLSYAALTPFPIVPWGCGEPGDYTHP